MSETTFGNTVSAVWATQLKLVCRDAGGEGQTTKNLQLHRDDQLLAGHDTSRHGSLCLSMSHRCTAMVMKNHVQVTLQAREFKWGLSVN